MKVRSRVKGRVRVMSALGLGSCYKLEMVRVRVRVGFRDDVNIRVEGPKQPALVNVTTDRQVDA